MQLGTVAKAAIASGLTTVGVIGATAAMAGSGVGGVFNLGQPNTVNGTSTLSGATSGAQLQVTNSSTAAQASGIGVTTASGRPPFTVNRNTRVANLNADLVDGHHASALMRAAQHGSNSGLIDPPVGTVESTVRVEVPEAGFVIVTGTLMASDFFSPSLCNICRPAMRLRDDATGATSPVTAERLGGLNIQDEIGLSMTFAFPATPGTHTYTMLSGNSGATGGGPPIFSNQVLTALFTPFGYAGGGHPLEPPPPTR